MTEQPSGDTGQLDRLAEIEAKFQSALDAKPPGVSVKNTATGEYHSVPAPYTHNNLSRDDVQDLITELKAANARIAELEGK